MLRLGEFEARDLSLLGGSWVVISGGSIGSIGFIGFIGFIGLIGFIGFMGSYKWGYK